MTVIETHIDDPFTNPDGRGDYHEDVVADSPAAEPESPEQQAAAYFAATHVIVSPTAPYQQWRQPGSELVLSAARARELSLAAAQRPVGRTALYSV